MRKLKIDFMDDIFGAFCFVEARGLLGEEENKILDYIVNSDVCYCESYVLVERVTKYFTEGKEQYLEFSFCCGDVLKLFIFGIHEDEEYNLKTKEGIRNCKAIITTNILTNNTSFIDFSEMLKILYKGVC